MTLAKKPLKIAVLGAGAWGSALAIHLSRIGHQVKLWDHNPENAATLDSARENVRYLKGVPFPDLLSVQSDLKATLTGVDAVLMVVPSQAFREVLQKMHHIMMGSKGHYHLAWATKGFEPETSLMLHEIVQQELGERISFAVLSGPTFAAEVARGLPTAMVSASRDQEEAQFWADAFHCDTFRMYTQPDVVGVEIGGAYKNIMAIATGLSDGLRLGANARAALIGRGMVEMMRFGDALGAKHETMMGLSGLGDLVLTCTDDLSRNRRFGLMLAQSQRPAEEVIQEIGQVVEGVKAVKAVKLIADKYQLDLPIMEQVYNIIVGNSTAEQAVKELMRRHGRSELEFA
ncbi:MAG: glycerol-3-phosphate dehydrogenase [Thiomicrospira sp.]|nr:MAG: glycerol-3-phosphate dehydrogenase [Thiomicrospira sp.]